MLGLFIVGDAVIVRRLNSGTLNDTYNSGAIVAIIDITILPAEEVVDPPLKLDVTYTNTSNQVVTRTFDVPVNFLLNGNSDNYDITDEDGIIKGTVELTDVKTGTNVDFMFYYDSVYRPELTNVKTLIQRVT